MKKYKVLGLMSGTSLDGLDLAYCHFSKSGPTWEFSIKATKSIDYDETRRQKLLESITYGTEELLTLDREFGEFLGREAAIFIKEEGIDVDFISSHGHTVHHRPDLGFTFQIGSGQQLAVTSGFPTICDFRTKDITLGGQGAPLVPIGDQQFFDNYTFCLNLGGISNVSLNRDGQRIAYDIGIANMLLNHLSRKLGKPFDKSGSLARSGNLDTALLNRLNSVAYYQKPFPKSTGFEWFKGEILPIIESGSLPVPDLLHTAVHHIAEQIARQLKSHIKTSNNTVLVTGGGAFNDFLMEVLRNKLAPDVEVVIPPAELVSFKEALVFALMGLLRIEGEINVLSSVTGASLDSSSGTVYYP